MNVKMCEVCKGTTQLLVSKENPEASEWYCEKCHKSYPVSEQDLQQLARRK